MNLKEFWLILKYSYWRIYVNINHLFKYHKGLILLFIAGVILGLML